MKKLNNFLDKAPLWQIYIFGWFFTGAFTALIFYGFKFIDSPNSKMLITGINCIKMGAIMGALFGLIFMLTASTIRKSQIFWKYAHEVEALIEEAETQDEMNSIFENQFQWLRKKCLGGPQITELNRLYTIMKTKYKYIK